MHVNTKGSARACQQRAQTRTHTRGLCIHSTHEVSVSTQRVSPSQSPSPRPSARRTQGMLWVPPFNPHLRRAPRRTRVQASLLVRLERERVHPRPRLERGSLNTCGASIGFLGLTFLHFTVKAPGFLGTFDLISRKFYTGGASIGFLGRDTLLVSGGACGHPVFCSLLHVHLVPHPEGNCHARGGRSWRT